MVALLTDKYTLESVIVSTRTADLYRVSIPATAGAGNLWLLRHTILPGSPAEARFMKRIEDIIDLKMPGISVMEYGVDSSGAAYVSMFPINGIKLSYTPRKIAQVERLIEGIIERIVTIHDAGLVCGDLTPSSFFLGEGGEVLWVGLIGSFEMEAQSTAAAPPIATYHYLSPEQRTGAGLNQASDVYSLGVLSYFLFSGQFPIGDSKRILLGPPDPATIVPIETFQPQTPPWAQVILPRCLTLNSAHRPSNARQLLDMIHSYREGATFGDAEEGDAADAGEGAIVRFGQSVKGVIERDQNVDMKVKEAESGLVDHASAHYNVRKSIRGKSGSLLQRVGPLVLVVGVCALLTVIGFVSFGGKKKGAAPVKNLAATGDESRLEGVIAKLNAEPDDLNYRSAVSLASELHIKNAKSLPKIEASILSAISKNYGQDLSSRVSDVLKSRFLDACYQSLLTILGPTVAVDDRFTLINDCLAVNQLAMVQLLSLIALQPNGSGDWEERLRVAAHEVLGVNNVEGRAIPAIIMSREALRSLISKEKQEQFIKDLSSDDLLWLFGSLSGETGEIFSSVSKEVVRRVAIVSPRSEFLKPFIDGEVLESRFRDGLIRAISGTVDVETIGLAGHWLNRSAVNILLALCSEAQEDEMRIKAFDTMASRKITQEPANSWVNYLKSSPVLWAKRGEYAKLICDTFFYDSLPDDRKEGIVQAIGPHASENGFLEALLRGGNWHLTRKVAFSYGKDFSPNYLMDLLKASDKETRIAALTHLKAYNDLYILRNIVEAFKREKDPDVKAVYRENYWAVRQHEEKNAGHELSERPAAGDKP